MPTVYTSETYVSPSDLRKRIPILWAALPEVMVSIVGIGDNRCHLRINTPGGEIYRSRPFELYRVEDYILRLKLLARRAGPTLLIHWGPDQNWTLNFLWGEWDAGL